jgi:hypothetical protein
MDGSENFARLLELSKFGTQFCHLALLLLGGKGPISKCAGVVLEEIDIVVSFEYSRAAVGAALPLLRKLDGFDLDDQVGERMSKLVETMGLKEILIRMRSVKFNTRKKLTMSRFIRSGEASRAVEVVQKSVCVCAASRIQGRRGNFCFAMRSRRKN